MDLNISREALSYNENGKREPSLALLVAMSKYYNVSINYLITGEEFQKRWTYLLRKQIGKFIFVCQYKSSAFTNKSSVIWNIMYAERINIKCLYVDATPV